MQLSSKELTTSSIVKDTLKGPDGFMGLYRGLSSKVYFAAPKTGIRFMAFEAVNNSLLDENGDDKYGLGAARGFIAGLVAGTAEAVIVATPEETLKIKFSNDMFRSDGKPPQYHNFFHGVKTILRTEGIGGVYKGMFPTILEVSTAQVL
jgi:solute carrier family 25 citrate transporter 1